MRAPARLSTLLAALTLAGCGAAQQPTRSPSRRQAATAGAAVDQEVTLTQFADAYLRFLDGRSRAARLPDSTVAVRREAARGGQLPAAKRAGPLSLVDITPAQGTPGGWFFSGRDRAHTFPAAATLKRAGAGWIVTRLATPDWTQDLTPSAAPTPASAGSAAPVAAARRFLSGYLPWQYGHAPLTVHDATSALTAALARNPPNIPPAMANQPTGRVLALTPERSARGWRVYATVADSASTYLLILTVQPTRRGGWSVTTVGGPTQ
ncbi:MAG: hypothetical protein ACLP8S_01100 [Solirubrobacteraceae bacterium]